MNQSGQQRITAFWREYERYSKVWSLECTLVMHFGRNQFLLADDVAGNVRYRNANLGWDPCLPEEGHPDYEIIDMFCRNAEAIIESRIPERGEGVLDKRLCGYPAGRRVDGGLNLGWSQPFQRIEASEELKDGLIAELKEATITAKTPPKRSE